MKAIVAVCFLAVVAAALARPNEEPHYTDKYDNLDLDEILGNKRLLDPYVECLLEKGKCTSEAKELKAHIKEALENHCGKCTETQKSGTRKVIGHLINKEAAHWKELSAKYDPEGKYTKKYEDELKTVKA